MLHVDFLRPVSRKGCIEPREMTPALPAFELFTVVKIRSLRLLTEKQPVSSFGADGFPVLQKGDKRRNAGARANHDDRAIGHRRQPKMCIHSAICFKGLPGVFDPRRKPWIITDNADKATIIAQVAKCPSGALSIAGKKEG